ncbi:MAG: flavin reductase [Pseudomonadota bacterium]
MDNQPFSARDLRDALSRFATGITIITATDAAGEPVGMTASSFNSVSMDPPLILWSVTKTALSAQAFHDAKHFAVHVLARDQMDLSNRFAKSGTDKFSGLKLDYCANGVPLLSETAARFDCQQWAVYEGGDHWIIVGQVLGISSSNDDPLVFANGTYAIANPLRPDIETDRKVGDQSSPIDGLLIYNLSRAYRQLADRFHDIVRGSGLTLSEWRVLASLHGHVSRDFNDLAVRTFVDPAALSDLLTEMGEEGLCTVDRDGAVVTVRATRAGHERVEHLFEFGEKLEQTTLSNTNDLQDLINLLREVIANTDHDIV